ncbi:hypothetical protein GCM10020367_65120 [Streptomyces sannanensis]|uniref:DUF6777 domain-containing protein n=1 Tax=Streptomyces sannanensis TaxID=285536 RepID=A0ABP6SN51_9ACTN
MRSPLRRQAFPAAVLAAGILAAGLTGCGGGERASGPQEIVLQPLAEQGPDPFTESTAVAPLPAPPVPTPTVTTPASPAAKGINRTGISTQLRTISGSVAGLYGGTRSRSSCDVERQVRLLTADPVKAGVFAKAAGVDRHSIPAFLRGLTPVLLRADTRFTSSGYRDGAAKTFQSLLQAGTPVLVDSHGAPRLRCTCGNPLRPPDATRAGAVHKGVRWAGYRPERAVVIVPAVHTIDSLIIVNIATNTWIERKTGDTGARDRTPRVMPPHDPGDDITGPLSPSSPSPQPDTSLPELPQLPDSRQPRGATPDSPLPESAGRGTSLPEPSTPEAPRPDGPAPDGLEPFAPDDGGTAPDITQCPPGGTGSSDLWPGCPDLSETEDPGSGLPPGPDDGFEAAGAAVPPAVKSGE